LLLGQQTKQGPYFGQFGDHADQSRDHQPSSLKDISTKPRLYMTLWPCRVLRRHGLAEDAVSNAITGVKGLFERGVVPGEEDSNPIPPRERFTSYRHSICGALILFEMSGRNPITDGVLGQMLDAQTPWRMPDGGWAHGDAPPPKSDLYTTLYAIELLEGIRLSPEADDELAHSVEQPLKSSLDYLQREWDTNNWSYGRLKSAESFPLAFAEVAGILQECRAELFAAVVNEILLNRNPAGGLRAEYRAKVKARVSDESCLARLAYASFLAQQPKRIWGGFAKRALAGNLGTLTSAELSWLLDIELATGISSVRWNLESTSK